MSDWSKVCIPYVEYPVAIASRISIAFSFTAMHSRTRAVEISTSTAGTIP
jgi:hypothetical protein